MSKTVIIGDVETLIFFLRAGTFSTSEVFALDFKVLDWLLLDPHHQAACMHYDIESVSLTENEVEEAFTMYQQDETHNVCMAQYGSLIYAQNNGTFLTSVNKLTLDMARRSNMIQIKIMPANGPRCKIPLYEVTKLSNNKINIAI